MTHFEFYQTFWQLCTRLRDVINTVISQRSEIQPSGSEAFKSMQLAMVLERLDQILRRVSQYSRSDKLVPDFMIDQIKNEIQPLNNSIEKLENKETDFLITKLLGEEVALGIDEINELVTKLDLVEQDITRTLG
jgi:hypothetical protein